MVAQIKLAGISIRTGEVGEILIRGGGKLAPVVHWCQQTFTTLPVKAPAPPSLCFNPLRYKLCVGNMGVQRIFLPGAVPFFARVACENFPTAPGKFLTAPSIFEFYLGAAVRNLLWAEN